MENTQEINNVCKEVITILGFFNNDVIEKIPSEILKKLNELAADSKLNYYIDKEKNLINQNISEKSKDLIALLYYSYIATQNEKDELSKIWNENENKYQEELYKIYNPNNIFKKIENQETIDIKNNSITSLINYNESFFIKLKKFVFKILHKQ